MVEVFKTNVREARQARWVTEQIHRTCDGHRANFDLDDCDRILRVASQSGGVDAPFLIDLLHHFGVQAEVLPD
ncbi:hypothetical protein SAMN05421823_104282 [Catalinimonas alkaloidigena]|uniref:Uncharacterized protein n=1 Tax=Catalinimonas alkaloidigena TaxID=1075417 RepID=A0A1G9H0R8_9BACT|nr:hypothetical protein [Catalinimonas alkaloidigena]SDL06540.1 hypothetical protein SAMN05421823_104282 [Catalinimonas alkaloidigena]